MLSYLRSFRLKSGLSQRELSTLAVVAGHQEVSKHERSTSIPSLFAALSYQEIFRASIDELFPGLYKTIRAHVEERLSEMETTLKNSSLKGCAAEVAAHKLMWLANRKNPTIFDS